MKTKLFFSSEAKRNGLLQQFCLEQHIALTTLPLISFRKIPFELNQHFDVVFFSSPRSVIYFFSENYDFSGKKIACIGKGTAVALMERNITPDFIGENSGNPQEVATNFIEWLGNKTVLFPVSSRSNETIYKMVPDNQKIKIVCYETILSPQQIEPQDWYVFTSPSNVESFLKLNQLPETAKVISWGKTTEKALNLQGISPAHVLEESSEEALVDYLSGHLV